MRITNNRQTGFKSGFIAIAGAPNAGKSTLLNRILGEKVSIISRKPQTTRNRILGVLHRPSSQFVFIDTPGVHKTKETFNIAMVDTALSTIWDVDAVIVVVDAASPDPESENFMMDKLKKQKHPVILALNKTDIVKKRVIPTLTNKWTRVYPFDFVLPISAKHGARVNELLDIIESILPYGPPFFSEETLTDLPERFVAAEMIREKIFRLTGREIPYSTAVVVDSFSRNQKGSLVTIHATINVERKSQKGIIIGKNGSKLKEIGIEARKEIEKMLGAKVLLKLFVRVQKNWSKDTKALKKFGYL